MIESRIWVETLPDALGQSWLRRGRKQGRGGGRRAFRKQCGRNRFDLAAEARYFLAVPDLFASAQPASFRSKLQSAVQRLAAEGIRIGTSSWKYNGWAGVLYDQQRYCYRGKFAETRFERECLAE